jgi:hypothetical protein
MQDILWITNVLACLSAHQKGRTQVCKTVKIMICKDFDLTVEEPKRHMNCFKRKFEVFADLNHQLCDFLSEFKDSLMFFLIIIWYGKVFHWMA